MNALHHAIHTNAAGSDGRGFRFVYRAPAWSTSDRRRLEGWLQGLDVTDTATPMGTCAVHCLRLGGTIHACLVSADGRFGVDGHGRPARLTHAVLIPLDERVPAEDWGGALLATRRAFGRPAAAPDDRLDAYGARCDVHRTCLLDPLMLNKALAIDDAVVSRVFSGAASMASELALDGTEDIAALLIQVTASLPPRLRLAFRWALGFGQVKGAALVRASAGPFAGGVEPRAAAYLGWLRRTGGLSLATDWRIRSWDELMTAAMSS